MDNHVRGTTMKFALVFLSFIGSLCAMLLFGSCGDSNADEASRNKSNNSLEAVYVNVEEVAPRPFVETLSLSGSIKAYDDILVSAEEGGVVKSWNYKKGDRISKGSVLAVLDSDVAKASYEAALAQYKSSALTLEKQSKVYQEQALSEWQYKTTEYNRDAAKAQAELLKARLERTKIKSPVNGILDDRYVDVGEMAAPGVPMARVVNTQRVKVLVNVPERYAGTIKRGAAISLAVIAYPGETFRGNITYIGATVNADNRTFPIESVIANAEGRLKPEMIARVSIVHSEEKSVLLVDESIVQQVDRNKYLVYVENGGKAQERRVELGGRSNNQVEIVSGLKSGDKVIVAGHNDVIQGQPVIVAKQEQRGSDRGDKRQ